MLISRYPVGYCCVTGAKELREIENLRQIALEYRKSGKLSDAFKAFEKLRTNFPLDQRVYIDLAIIHRMRKEFREAKAILELFLDSGFADSNWRSRALSTLAELQYQLILEQLMQPLQKKELNELRSQWTGLARSGGAEHVRDLHNLTAFRLSEALGTADIQSYTLLEFLKAQSRPITEYNQTIGALVKYFWDTQADINADELIELLDNESHLRARLLMERDAKNEKLDPDKEYHPSPTKFLIAVKNTLILNKAMSNLDHESSNNKLIELQKFHNDSEPKMLRVKRAYLEEMASLPNRRDIITSLEPLGQDRHEIFLNRLRDTPSYKHKVMVASYYLSLEQKNSARTAVAFAPPVDIPRLCLQFWDTARVPDDVARCMDSIKYGLPSFEHRLFDQNTASDYIEKAYGQEWKAKFWAASHPAIKSDIFRVLYLYECGGLWIDADEQYYPKSSAAVDDLMLTNTLRYQRVCGFEVLNGFIAVEKNNRFLRRLVEHMSAFDSWTPRDVWWITGPGSFTYQLALMYAEDHLSNKVFDWSLVENTMYSQIFRGPTLEYKDTNLSWQNLI
ncbi:capsular polysaccharide synthesis protein [Thioclava sp. 'Guangxiensis']|uniref:capsular polysaccharide synthesis protein n=1 Tax=Thioclava sp. 'Guangxiensis' TaxID=3149044 RepID=UPI0038781FF0